MRTKCFGTRLLGWPLGWYFQGTLVFDWKTRHDERIPAAHENVDPLAVAVGFYNSLSRSLYQTDNKLEEHSTQKADHANID